MEEFDKNELESQLNNLKQYLFDYSNSYANLFAEGLFHSGIIKDITPEQLQSYFANPDVNQDLISDIAEYFYIINAEIHQLFELAESIPELNYNIKCFESQGSEDKNIIKLKKAFHKIRHKRLTRDLVKQTASTGNVAGVWLGSGEKVYPYIFDDFRYIVGGFRNLQGNWQLVLSASFFDCAFGNQREYYINEFRSLFTRDEIDKLLKREITEIILPEERTIFIGTGKLNRNQFLGTSWITPVMMDVLHKRKLKDVEQTIANKIINAVAVLTIGSFDGKEKDNQGNLVRDYNKLPDSLVKNIHNNVKKVLSEGSKNGMSLVSLPNFVDIKFPKIDSDGLDNGKFSQTNSDITKGLGISGTAMNGEGANYNSARLNLELFYTRLGVILEEIEYTYQKFINLTLPSKYRDDYYMEYNKGVPLSTKDKVQHLKGLYDKGWSAKTYIESLGYDFDIMLKETKEEIDMGLSRTLVPPPTSYTLNSEKILDGEIGAPKVDDSEASDNTIRTRDSQGD